jgi:hypothetical protein
VDRLRQRRSVAGQVAATLRELAVRTAPSTIERDSAIRACHEAGLLQSAQAEQALAMADDRNLTAHTYNEGLAEAIFKRLPGHLATLEVWLGAMQNRLPAKS